MDETKQLQESELVREFAQVKTQDPELYNLMAKTRPMLKMLVDVSDQIMNEKPEVEA
jgi:hypothetical protein